MKDLDSPKTVVKIKPEISIDLFSQIDLRIGKILTAEEVPNSEKLLSLTIDLNEGQPRKIFAGIKNAYTPEELIGKLTLVIANLAPRKMRFGTSDGMLLVASLEQTGDQKRNLFLLEPHGGAEPGMKVA